MTTDGRIRSAKQALDEAFNQLKGRDGYLGFIGRGDVDKTVLVPNRPGFVFVRVPKKIEDGELIEFSEHIAFSPNEQRHGAPVLVVRSKKNPAIYEVESIWSVGIGSSLIGAAASMVTPHARTHELYTNAGGGDPVMLDTLQMKNLQVTPTSPPSSRVRVGAGWYMWRDQAVHWYDGEEIDLVEYIPTGSLSTYCNLWLDPDTQDVSIHAVSQGIAPYAQLPIEDLVLWPPVVDAIPLACVRLVGDTFIITWQTSATGDPNFIDLRLHQAMMPGQLITHALNPDEAYHSGTLDSSYVDVPDPSGFYSSGTLEGMMLELGMTKTKVRVTANDTYPNYLLPKLNAGEGITLTELNDGGDEDASIAVDITGLPAAAALDAINDRFMIYDNSEGDLRQVAPSEIEVLVYHQALWSFTGELTAVASPLRIYNATGQAKTIDKVFVAVDTAPDTQKLIVDIHKDGVTIFTNQAHRPEVAIAANTGETTDIDVDAWAADSYLIAEIDQADGEDCTVHVVYH